MFMYMCGCLQSPKEVVKSLIARVTGICEPPDGGNRSLVLWKNSKCS